MSKRICLHCNKPKQFKDKDYSNFNFTKKNYAFPDRINFKKIPQTPKDNFICAECATNYYPLSCNVHGEIIGKFEYGNSPKCEKCETDFSKILNGNLPDSFKALMPLSKISKNGKSLDKNIWYAISKNNNVHLIGKNCRLSEAFENFNFKASFEDESLILLGHHLSNTNEFFQIVLDSFDDIGKGIGPWCKPWLNKFMALTKNTQNIFFSKFEYSTIFKNSHPDISKSFFVFWTTFANEITCWKKNNPFPSLEKLKKWAIKQSDNEVEVKLLFDIDRLPSLLTIRQAHIPIGLKSISTMNFPESKKCNYSEIQLKNLIGPIDFIINDSGPEAMLMEKKSECIELTSLAQGIKHRFNYGYLKNDYLLLIDEKNNNYAISTSRFSIFNDLLTSIKTPKDIFENRHDKFIICFDQNLPGKTLKISFFELGFEINNNRFAYKGLGKLDFIIDQGKEAATLTVELKDHQKFKFSGPESYIKAAWKEFENFKISKDIEKLSTNNLYREYNKRKKENLLIGLLSDITLFNKELDSVIPLDKLEIKLESMNEDEFKKDRKVYEQTIKKLLMISNFLPKIKKDYVRIDTYYPHYQLKNELNFLSKAFGSEVAKTMESSEFGNVIRASRNNINFLQNKFNKIFFEIEKSIGVVDNIFAEQEIQKNFMARMAKFSVKGGQAVLIGGLIATGATMGGVGILAGMLGIRTMGDILSSFHLDKKQNKVVKGSAQKIFGWWQIFKQTFPMVVYEASKMIDKENERTVNRDNKIFLQLKQQGKMEIDALNEILKKEIEQFNQIKFREVLNNSGILFDEIANEINKSIEMQDYLLIENHPSNIIDSGEYAK